MRSSGDRATMARATRCSMAGASPSHASIKVVHIGQGSLRFGPYMKL